MQVHPDFQIQGRSFANTNELLEYVKENFPSHILFLEDLLDDKNYILAQTSGSTGKPKKIRLNKKAVVHSAKTSIDFFELSQGTKALLNLSSDYIAGKMMWVRALVGGWNLTISSPRNKEIRKILLKEKFDFGAMVPLQLISNFDLLENINLLIVGGGALDETFINKIDNLRSSIFATYGMTETITHIAVSPLNHMAESFKPGLEKNIYIALPNIEFHKDKRNCLVIKAPKLNEEEIITNDVVELIDPCHFIWKGRYDHIINTGGIKIYPEEIEKILSPFIPQDFFISSIQDPKFGNKIVLVVEGSKKINISFENILPKYSIPKQIIYLPEFIKTASGKIARYKTMELINKD